MATRTLLTAEQFEQLPDDGMRHELDQGELIVMPPPGLPHAIVQARVIELLSVFVNTQSFGVVLGEAGFRLGSETVRAPDAAFIRAQRIRERDLDRFEGGPDLAIEVISPSESAVDIDRKVDQYLAAGAIVWVLYPSSRKVVVWDSSKQARSYSGDDVLECPALLPGFSVRVSEFFV
jgi:Uma2 family endonuclease